MIKCMKLLNNSNCGINPLQKCLLYRTCILPIVLYRFQLWFYNHAPMTYHLKALGKCKEEQPYGSQGPSKHPCHMVLKLLLGSFPLNFTSRSLVEDHNLEHINFCLTTSYTLSSILKVICIHHKTLYISTLSPNINTHLSKAIQLTWLIGLMKVSCLLLLSILNFCLDLE